MASDSTRQDTSDNDTADTGTSALDRLKAEITAYLEARATHAVDAIGDRISGAAHKLTGDGDGGGFDPLSLGKRFLGEKAKDTKDKVTGGVKDLVGAGGDGGGGSGDGIGKAGDTKVTSIIESVDIGLPRRTVYNHWTELEEFSGFTKGVQSVNMSDEVESDWKLKIAFSQRSWKATVQEQVPDERIVWTSEGDKGSTRGCVSFHEVTPSLTRVVLVVEYYPAGFFEKTGNLWRAQGRRIRLDLKHFQRYVTLNEDDEEVEGWRGEIRDGEVVVSHEDAVENEEADDGEDEDSYDDEEEEDTEEEDEEDEQR